MSRRFLRSTEGAMTLTVSQMFLGAISLGLAMHRGTEVYTAFHQETLVAHSNYASSKVAAEHARSANVVANDNVVMTAIMGPRFAVEADNITMDVNAAIACPTCPYGNICYICSQYAQNKPRALLKLLWVRAKQKALWGALGKLSSDVDRLAAIQASTLVTGDLARVDARVRVRFEDPARTKDIWGGTNTAVSCKLAVKDVLPSPMLGHAFPLLISQNLVEGLPRVLVQAMPEKICEATNPSSTPASPDVGTVKLGQIPPVAEKTRDDCRELEKEMRCAIAAGRGEAGSCQDYSEPERVHVRRKKDVTFSKDVERFMTCQTATPGTPLRDTAGGGYTYRNGNQIVTCTFDRDRCEDKLLTENSNEYLRDKLGLPKVVADIAESLGGDETRAPNAGGGSGSADFCACTYTARPIDETIIGISDAVRRIASFGTAPPSEELRRRRDYRACGKWYFPDGKGEFSSVPKDEQPFVGAWKWGLQDRCPGSATGSVK